MIERICNNCGKEFLARPDKVKKGEGLYCSKNCVTISVHKRGKGRGYFQKGHKPFRKFRENHPLWKGVGASYESKHGFVSKNLGKARDKRCFYCGISGKDKRLEWANIDHKYSRNTGDYLPLCCSCHYHWDVSHNLRFNPNSHSRIYSY